MCSNYNSNCFEKEKKSQQNRDYPNILVMDTSLRDGEQNPFCALYPDEKIVLAKKIEELNVDIMEVGFAASRGGVDLMREIAKNMSVPYLCGLSRAMKPDIDATYEAFRDYDKRMIHIFLPTSREQVDAKLGKSEDELVEMAAEAVRYASKYFPVVEFTPEDSVRSDPNTLERICKEVLAQGASVINIADTVGYAVPDEFAELVANITALVKSQNHEARVSVHCHNDYGLASANTFYAIKNGAEQVEATVLGIGERAGNCSLEQIVALSLRNPRFFRTNVDSEKLYEAAEKLQEMTEVQMNMAPILGETAFSHKSGIHQHGVMNNPEAYEVIKAEDFGRKTKIVIGPCSGYHGVLTKAKELGYEISKGQAIAVIDRTAKMVEEGVKKTFSDEDMGNILRKLIKQG